jgi:hypothetical protein
MVYKEVIFMKHFSKKIFLCLSLLCVGQTFPNIFNDGAQWATNLYCSSLSNIEHKMGVPQKSLQVGLPTTACLGLLGYLVCPEENLQQIRTYAKWIAAGSAALCGAYGLQWTKRWWNFYRLGNTLRDASFVVTAHRDKFRYATWKKKQWPLGSDLLDNKKAVQDKLKHDVTACSDQAYNGKGEPIDHSKKISSLDVQDWINNELEKLKGYLQAISLCTDANEVIIAFLEENNQNISDIVPAFTNIIENMNYLGGLNEAALNDLITCIKNHCRKHYAQQSLFAKMVHFPDNHQFWRYQWLPDHPRVAPHYLYAAELYCELLCHCIRLSALKTVADEMSWKVDPNKPKPLHVDVTTKKEKAEKED